MDWICVCNGELPNDFEVETIIGKHFDDNNKVEWLSEVDGMWTV